MNILLLGSGGREDALAWRLRQSPSCDKLIAAPGNPGIARWADCVAIDPCDADAVFELAEAQSIDLLVIVPEPPLFARVGDTAAPGSARWYLHYGDRQRPLLRAGSITQVAFAIR